MRAPFRSRPLVHSLVAALLGVPLACGGTTDGSSGSGTVFGAGGSSGGGQSGTGAAASSGGDTGGGSGGDTGGGGAGATGGGDTGCTVAFSVTTLDNHGRYSPRNVSAIWVTDAQGAFVRTLEENGYRRQSHLVAWNAEAHGSTVDAVTGATNSAPRTHDATWDCADVSGNVVPPGGYTMNAEFATENNNFSNPSPHVAVPFQLGSGAISLSPPDEQYFVQMTLTTSE